VDSVHALILYGAFPLALVAGGLMIVLCLLKGDVKAAFKIPFVAFIFEAKEQRTKKGVKAIRKKP